MKTYTRLTENIGSRAKALLTQAAGLLLHPAFLIAIAVLFINDSFLKGSDLLPGLLTGKLSDFAGLFCLPVFVAVLLRPGSFRALIVVSTAIGLIFALVKAVPVVNTFVAQLLGIVIVLDTYDLLALSVLPLSVLLVRSVWGKVFDRASRGWYRTKRLAAALVFCCSGVVFVASSPPIPPNPPSGRITAGEVGSTSIELSWTKGQSSKYTGIYVSDWEVYDVEDATYTVTWNSVSGPLLSQVFGPTSTSGDLGTRYTYTITGLIPNTKYEINMSAQKAMTYYAPLLVLTLP